MKLFLLLENQKILQKQKLHLLKKVWSFQKSKIDKDVLEVNELSTKKEYQLSDHQVKAILELRLQKLTI